MKHLENYKLFEGKTLKIWNGRGHGKFNNGSIYVAAYTKKQAAELVSKACYGDDAPNVINVREISEYYNEGSWGNEMNNIDPTEPCVYASEKLYGEKPKKII